MIETPQRDWLDANGELLDAELDRLRLLLHRRMLWLRSRWSATESPRYPGLVVTDDDADRLVAGPARAAELRFYDEDPAAQELSRAVASAEDALDERRRAEADAGQPAALDVLCSRLALDRFERDVVLLCVAPELDSSFETLFAYVQDDVARKQPTPALALALCAGAARDWLDARARLVPQAGLRRLRVIDLDAGSSLGSRAMRADPRVADFVLGIDRPDERASDVLRAVAAAPLAPGHAQIADRLERRLRDAEAGWPLPVLDLTGEPGSGRRAVAAAVCDRLALTLWELLPDRVPAPGPERRELLDVLERESALAGLAYLVDADAVGDDHGLAAELVERLPGLVVVAGRTRLRADRQTLAADVARPRAAEQRELWRAALGEHAAAVNGSVDALVEQFDLGPAAVADAVRAATGRAEARAADDGDGAVTHDDLWLACRERAARQLDDLARRIEAAYGWDDIVLPDELMRQLRQVAAQVAHRPQVYEDWGFGRKLHRGRGISALFAGPSGTGKTMAAEVLAHELRLDLWRIDLSGVVSKYIGETEKNLRRVFDTADESGSILFFDEADALFGKRSEVKDSHDRYANIEVNYLLQRMEDYRGLAILATNRKSFLDDAFMRRLRFVLDFPFPDEGLRRGIWERAFPDKAETEGLDLARLAGLEIAGGNIKTIALNAAFMAADAGTPIRMEHVVEAARREYAKLDRLMLDVELGGGSREGRA